MDEELTSDKAEAILQMCVDSIDEDSIKEFTKYQKILLTTKQIYTAGFLQATMMAADSLKIAYDELFDIHEVETV